MAWAKDWGGIREKTAEAIAYVRDIIEKGLAAIRAFWAGHGEGILRVLRGMWSTISSYFEMGWENLKSILRAAGAIFRGDWEELGRQLRQIWERTTDWWRDFVERLGEIVADGLRAIGQRIVEWWNGIDWAALGQQAGNALRDGLSNGLNGAGGGFTFMPGVMGAAAESGAAAGARFHEQFIKGWREEGEIQNEIFSPEIVREAAHMAEASARALADAQREAQQEAATGWRTASQQLLGVSEGFDRTAEAADRASRSIGGWDTYLRAAHNNLKLGADRSNHFAAGIDALTDAASRNKAAMDAAKASAEQYAGAFAAVQGDYTTELPQAEQPLVAPERTVSVVTQVSGPTEAQAALVERYQSELEKLRETYTELTNGVGTFGMKQEDLDAKIAATAKAWGCTGGEGEKESEASGVYELNDAKCADGANYDIKLDKAFKVISITAD